MILEITDQNFEDAVIKSDLPVALDFWAPWCGPCNKGIQWKIQVLQA